MLSRLAATLRSRQAGGEGAAGENATIVLDDNCVVCSSIPRIRILRYADSSSGDVMIKATHRP